MKTKFATRLQTLLTTAAIAMAWSASALAASMQVTAPKAADLKADAKAQYGQVPISFESNRGQTDAQVRFLSRGPGYSLFLTPAEAVLSLRTKGKAEANAVAMGNLRQPEDANDVQGAVVRLSFDGAKRNPALVGQDRQAATSNYFLGTNANQWRRDLPNFAKVRYEDLYPGVDLLYYGNQSQLEYDLIVAAGADPSPISLRIAGADRLSVNPNGDLVLDTSSGQLLQHAPIAFQDVAGKRVPVSAHYTLLGDNRVGFRLGDYDRSQALVIDPVLVYSTYLGGTLGDRAYDVYVDSAKNAYVTGYSNSAAFPTKGGYQSTNKGAGDVFVAKLSPTGTILYSTYIGGSGSDEAAGIAVDASGNAYVTGRTTSIDYPTVSAFQSTLGGVQDAFVTKLSATGNALVYSTYLGGNANTINTANPGATGEYGYGIAVDANGSAYVSGWTVSTNFPTVNPIQATRSAAPAACDPAVDASKCARSEAFVSKFAANGASLIYSTYLGGTEYDESYSLTLDSSGNAYITGMTISAGFPTASPKQVTNAGNGDAFVTKINAAGSALVYSTYLGGVGQDFGYGIALGSDNSAFVVGVTASANFPTVTPAQAYNGGAGGSATDGFITKVAPAGNAWTYSTWVGGAGADSANGVAIDAADNAYIVGQGGSATNFPISNAFQSTMAGGTADAFLVKLAASGSAFVYGTFLGGSGDDFGNDVAIDSAGDAYIVGYTASANFPVLNAAQATNAGSQDAFVARLSSSSDATISVGDASLSEGNSGTSSMTFTVTLSKALTNAVTFNIGTGGGTATAGNDYVVTSLTGQTIAAGTTSKTFTVLINGDTTVEPDETFFMNLSAVSGALIGDGQGQGTILNDDQAAPLSLSIADVSLNEGNSGTTSFTFTVTQSGVSGTNTTFNLATADGTAVAGSDYVANSASGLSIPAGSTTKTFTVLVNGDTITEPNETFFVNLTNASGATIADGQAVGNINNDDTAPLPSLSVGDVSLTEGNSGTSVMTFTVTLSAVAQADVKFDVFTSNNTAAAGSDYVALNLAGQVIPAGSSNKTFSVTINGDTALESNETFFFNVSNITGATVLDGQAVGTILNDDTATLPAISVADVRVTEGNSGTVIATFTVQLSAVPANTVSFDVATANGTATAGSDYVALALTGQTIAAGITSKTFNVTINGDSTVESDETFSFNVSNPVNATISDGTAIGTIVNDDTTGTAPPTISVNDVTTTEGNNGNKSMTFTVSLSAASVNPVTFDINTSNGTAFAGSDYVENIQTSQTIPAGQTSYSFTVTVNPDTQVEPNETFTVNLNNVSGAVVLDAQGLGVISNDDSASVSVNPTSLTEGNSGQSTAIFTITLSMPMPTPVTFDITTGNGTATAGSDYVATSATSVLIDAGRTRATFDVQVIGDTVTEADETFKVTISNVSGATIGTASANATIVNDDLAAMTISQIQGTSQLSPVVDQEVSTEGVVTALTSEGFYLQSADNEQDSDARSSEGLYVLGASAAQVGDRVKVAGMVREALVGAGSDQLTQTQLASSKIDTLARGQALPRAISLDAATVAADPSVTGLERFEGMRVSVPELVVVAASGGTVNEATGQVSGNGKFYAVARGINRPFLEPGLNVLARAQAVAGVSPQIFDANPERLLVDSLGQRGARALSTDAGDSLRGMVGVLGYGSGSFRLLPDPNASIAVASGAAPKAVSAARNGEATIASFPLRRFFDDSRASNEPVLNSTAYATRLAKTANAICAFTRNPDILGVSGVENRAVLGDIAAATNAKDGNLLFPGSCASSANYQAALPSGATSQLGFLVNTAQVRPGVARVEVIANSQANNASFRQRDGSSEALFAQAPMFLEARINEANGRSSAVTVLSVQMSALEGDLQARGTHGWTSRGDYLRARRAAQARSIAMLVQQRQAARPNEKLVVLGDFEAAQFNDGYSDLLGTVSGRSAARAKLLDYVDSPVTTALTNLTTRLPAGQRYTVVREGNAQAVDHILVNAALLQSSPAVRAEVARINADFGEDNYGDANVPVRVSDHDPMVMYLDLN